MTKKDKLSHLLGMFRAEKYHLEPTRQDVRLFLFNEASQLRDALLSIEMIHSGMTYEKRKK